MVPRGWSQGKIKNLVKSLDAGVSVNSEDKNYGVEKYILKTSCISAGYYDASEIKAVTDPEEIQRLKEPLLSNSILISRMNTPALVGANAYIKEGNKNFYLPDRLWQVKIKKNVCITRWLAYWFASDHTRHILSSLGTGTSGSMKNISKKDVLSLNVLIPPLAEQEKIAEILSTWDQAIDSTEKRIANAELQKKALMQQLLTGKKRLLNENGERFSGKWEKVKLGSLIQEIKKEKVQNPNEIELLTVRLHHKGAIPSGKFPKATAKGRPYYRRCKGELIIGRQNLHNGGIAIVNEECHDLIASNAISSFKNTSLADIQFLLCLMSTNQFKFTVDTLTGGTGQKEISTIELKKIIIKVPEIQEQQKIAEVLSTADREIELLTEKLGYLKAEKRALMQQLLTGKRRVKVA